MPITRHGKLSEPFQAVPGWEHQQKLGCGCAGRCMKDYPGALFVAVSRLPLAPCCGRGPGWSRRGQRVEESPGGMARAVQGRHSTVAPRLMPCYERPLRAAVPPPVHSLLCSTWVFSIITPAGVPRDTSCSPCPLQAVFPDGLLSLSPWDTTLVQRWLLSGTTFND